MRNERVKRETSVGKIGSKGLVVGSQLNELPVAGQSTSEMLPKSQTSTFVSRDGEQKRARVSRLTANQPCVSVLSVDRKPLMPTTPSRARRWIKTGKATPFYNKGIFCVRLNVETGKQVQEIACGIDPGSKKEGFTIKSEAHTFLNIQADAVTWVKDAVEVRRNIRKSRRQRKTPCRKNRVNRSRGCLPPSTKSRWQWKLRLATWLSKVYPISCFVVEDIKAKTKGQRKWDQSFSPLEVGKNWFYCELDKLGKVELKQGWETAEMRSQAGLKKTKNKMDAVFSAHCIDSWVLANWFTGGHVKPDNEKLLMVVPLQFHRRQLHALQPASGGVRRLYGGTRSLGFKRGSVVTHPKYGKTYVGGTSNGRISLHSVATGKRLAQNVKVSDCIFVAYNTWRTALPLPVKADSLRAGK
jgi:hypothetical protein